MDKVLVSGGSGFVGSHVILQLLNAGYAVRTTVRSLAREAGVRGMLKDAGVDATGRLKFVAADLERDEGWPAGGDGLRLRHPRGVAHPRGGAQKRGRADQAGARWGAPRPEGGSRRERQAPGADLVVRRHLLRPPPADRAIRRNELDQSRRAR